MLLSDTLNQHTYDTSQGFEGLQLSITQAGFLQQLGRFKY